MSLLCSTLDGGAERITIIKMIISYVPTTNDSLPLCRIYGTQQELTAYLEGYMLFTTTGDSYWVRLWYSHKEHRPLYIWRG